MNPAAKVVALLCVAGLLVAGAIFVLRPEPTTTVVAEFGQVDGVYPGSKVDILGVPIGEVRAVDPAGSRVRVTLSLPAGTKVPAQAQAWVMSPAVISDKYVELTPAYTTGATLPDGGVIPPDRAHAPVKWDDLMKSLNTLLTTLAPGDPAAGAPLGDALAAAAKLLDGKGQAFRDAITQVNQTSGVVAGQLPDASALLDTLATLVSTLDKNKSAVDSVTSSVTMAADEFGKQQDSIASTVEDLSVAMTDLADLLKNHGAELTKDVSQLGSLAAELGKHQGQLAELLDTLPLAGQNLSRAVSPDHRLRTRIDVSTNFSQFALGKELCAKLPLPLCSGAGITNPVRFPPSVGDPLGLPSVLAPPAKTGGN
ncbi:MCE family protein [Amycolatopsis minnesotensis]|uniref:MCE family protein n=1 Tax=Amycolatopsis minnesotensis TaxID=337894 RepID=A0ABN2RRG8_9PSEU